MPSRRKIKKEIKKETNLLIEDAFIESINGDAKESKKMDGLIDELIDKRFELISKVSNYPNNGKRAEVKEYFKGVKEDLSKEVSNYTKKIGHVG